MKIIKNWSISTASDNIFAKVELKNFCKHNKVEHYEFYIFVLMELTTNLIKYANGGNIWLINHEDKYCLASADRGCGIKDLTQAKIKGFTSSKNSLGLGLFQIRQNSYFDAEIYTSTQKKGSGTVVLLKPKEMNSNILFFSKPYMNLDYNGDYFIQKGRFSIFGDASGHGIKAQKSATFIKKYFMDKFISCLNHNLFYDNLHNLLKKNNLRSSVMCLIEFNKNILQLCGVGNLNIFTQEGKKYNYATFKNGIVGEVFNSSELKQIDLHKNQNIIITTDGYEPRQTKDFLSSLQSDLSPMMVAVCLTHFISNDMDDSSVLIIKKG